MAFGFVQSLVVGTDLNRKTVDVTWVQTVALCVFWLSAHFFKQSFKHVILYVDD